MADRDGATSSSSYTQNDRDTDTRFAHKNLGWPWLLALLLVPLLLAALLAGLRGSDIETDLKERSVSELRTEGIDPNGIDIDFDGRDATLKAASGTDLSKADLDKVKDVVADVEGVRVADVDTAGLAGSGSGDESSEDPPAGEPTDEATGEPTEEPSTEEPTEAPPAACVAADVQSTVTGKLGKDEIQFDEGQGDLSPGGLKEVESIAVVLAPCADVTITVTGFGDIAGAKGTLPAARAEAVKQALVDGGVAAELITAAGSPEAGTLGDNATPEGRDQNRYATVEIG